MNPDRLGDRAGAALTIAEDRFPRRQSAHQLAAVNAPEVSATRETNITRCATPTGAGANAWPGLVIKYDGHSAGD
ncbi:1,2-phenylacetyl-CoA epoxidase PaaB subunit [Arthrobacter bambusae]|uniref:1,2-phenylacetyl-CoA epoxidase PaaB subunit n=1 Tax=Arthrobacter bambusae TaxID=1338426 RepID=A0AAW8DFQ3_9MICC|nr:1,2-phenylacetyl-CoA epoxidase PaaB subunit [Arthrobacter bambusae]MDQ0127854.1 1,2-phenylacetyl-CoA epoxidase PaaB subunit [Arthrobacter bambusae]MDQ0179196.1 1,2-phenylacetyl-CoA epoxidase PaaB subunit [Arthrobacter bambusae]